MASYIIEYLCTDSRGRSHVIEGRTVPAADLRSALLRALSDKAVPEDADTLKVRPAEIVPRGAADAEVRAAVGAGAAAAVMPRQA